MNNKSEAISVFGGTGFIGSQFINISSRPTILIPREKRTPKSKELVYFISTTDNYNVLENIHIDVDVNIQILLDVLAEAKKTGTTINFISSWFVYGECPLPATEESHCQPKGFYSITKYAAEQLLISYCRTFNLDYRILRLCNVFGGKDQGASKKKNALQFLVNEIKNNQPINLYHNGEFYRDYMHVSDVAAAIDLVINKGELNTIYNIGSGDKTNFRTLIDHAMTLTQSNSKITQVEPTDFHKIVQVKDFYMDTTKLKKLGFKPKINVLDGITELCQ